MLATATTLWFVTRASGAVALLLVTASVLLGIATSVRWKTARWPRFAVTSIHRNLTLLAIAFVVVHVVTTVADGYAPISIVSLVVPFSSPYRTLWLGLGTVAFDLLLALVASSLARGWLRPTWWRALHWSAYAVWPVALVHAFGTGSDARHGWFTALGFASLAAVALAALARVALARGGRTIRVAAGAAALAVPLLLFTWYRSGPAVSGWAARSGTPSRLLASRASVARAATSVPVTSRPAAPTSFVSALSGRIHQSRSGTGLVTVRIAVRLRGGPRGAARIDLRGVPQDGGVVLTAGGASFVPASTRAVYTGTIVALEGTRVIADVRDAAGDALRLQFALQIDDARGSVGGIVAAGASGGDQG